MVEMLPENVWLQANNKNDYYQKTTFMAWQPHINHFQMIVQV